MFTKIPAVLTVFENLPDPRVEGGNKRHLLPDLIFVALCGTVCGCESWTEVEQFAREKIDWFRKYVPLEHGVPSHDTLGRVFAALDTAAFQVCLQDWVEQLQIDLQGQSVHIDGKTIRRSFDAATNKQALHMVSAWASGLSLCLGQVATDAKSNEITAVPLLLDLLELRGSVVTLDAMHCQSRTVAKIRDRGADYLITVKRNQTKLFQLIHEAFVAFGEENYTSHQVRSHRTTRKTRGRIEERTVYVSAAPRALKETGRWADIKTIGMIYRHRQRDPNSRSSKPIAESDHVTYFISSLPPTAKRVAQHVHSHWSIENSLHWTLDVTFTEDRSRIRRGNAPEVMASLRRLALSLLKRDTSLPKHSIRAKRLVAGWNEHTLEAIISGK